MKRSKKSDCNIDKLSGLLLDKLSATELSRVEKHLENCESCKSKLENMAADNEYWSKAALHLAQLQSANQTLLPDTPKWVESSNTIAVRAVESDPGSDSFYVDASIPLDKASHPEMLGRIDGFEIEQVIGRGGMGIVYKGFDTELNRPVAIKVLAPHLAASGVARKRFAREAQAAAAVVHPNVVPIHSVSSLPERPYIVMTLVSGRSLQKYVDATGPLPLKDIVRISQQISAGLAAAHQQGLVHRDIKPANILLEKDVSRVMITDFGLARAVDDAAVTQTGWLAGTPHYMSPEQAKGLDVDHRSDLFSLGTVMYFMATGREPFRAEKPFAILQKITSGQPARPQELNNDVPRTLANIIDRLHAKEPRDRFQTADDVQDVLTRYLAHLQNPLGQPIPKVRGTRRSSRRWPSPWNLVTASALLALAAIFAFSQFARPQYNGPPSINFDWMQGLQSNDQWSADADSLTREIAQMEWEMGLTETAPAATNRIQIELRRSYESNGSAVDEEQHENKP